MTPVSNYKPQPGHLGNLTLTQQDALNKLREQLKAKGHFIQKRMDDSMLLRFLRECKFDVGQTNTMVLSAEQWRKEFGVDDIVKNFRENEEVNKYYPQYYHKTAKDGRPVYIEHLGKISGLGDTSQDFLLRRFVLGYEKFYSDRLPACTQAAGHPVETSCTIMDISGVGFGSFFNPKFLRQIFKIKKFVSQTDKISRECYPGTTSDVYIVNVPSWFSSLWEEIKSESLDKKTAENIHIVEAHDVKETLTRHISPENLPVEFGGWCKCLGGCASSDAGPWQVRQ